MKKLMNYFLLMMLVPAIMFTGCKDDNPDPAKGNYSTLVTYMADNNMNLTGDELLNGWVTAPTVESGIVDTTDGVYTIPGFHVFDIRSEADFKAGHVKDAINVALADVITEANDRGKDKPILVFCYSGQTAGRAVMALRLSGFTDAKVAKFGFSYWSSDEYTVDGTDKSFDKWTPKISDIADTDPNWNMDDSQSLPSNELPNWTSSTTDGAALLAERVKAMLALDWGTSSADVLATPANYNIYNFWPEEPYKSIGHYDGAYLFPTCSFETVNALPQSSEFQIYCYTGQTSSFATAWLQVLGYNAMSITYGVNSLRHAAVDAYKSSVAWQKSHEYKYETTTK